MKNKKGFTLVELLAVIAILAILVIIALPNVMGMFGNAKKELFVNEIRELHHLASHDWIVDSFSVSGTKTYIQTKESCSDCKKIDASVRDSLQYEITIDSSGNIIEFYATDDSYQFGYSGEGLTTKDITEENVIMVSEIEEKQPNEESTIETTRLTITADGSNIKKPVVTTTTTPSGDDNGDNNGDNPGEIIDLKPMDVVTVLYYYNNKLVTSTIYQSGDEKYFANFTGCTAGGEFLNWRTEDSSHTFAANQEITDEIINELGKKIKLYAVCRYNFLPNPNKPVSY